MKPQEECDYTNQTAASNSKHEEQITKGNYLIKNPCTKRESDICESDRNLVENEINIIENKIDIIKKSRRTLSYIDNQSGFQREECKMKTSDMLKNELIKLGKKRNKVKSIAVIKYEDIDDINNNRSNNDSNETGNENENEQMEIEQSQNDNIIMIVIIMVIAIILGVGVPILCLR